MKLESLKHKTESLTRILLAVAVLLGALTFLRIGSFLNSSQAVARAGQVDPSGTGANDLKTVLDQTKASVNELKKNNLFVPGAARQYPVNEVIGILGHEALIGGKWYKAGDSVGEARILAIEPTKVRIVWNGQEKEFSPIGATGGGPGGKPDRAALASKKPGTGAPGKVVVTNSRRGPGARGSGVSEQEKEQRRQRWANVSPEERQRLRNEMQQQKPPKKNR